MRFGASAVLFVFLGMVLIRIGELYLHRVNKKFLVFSGSDMKGEKLMRAFYLCEWLCLGLCLFEAYFFEKRIVIMQQYAGLFVIVMGTWLRAWARASLGRTWSMGLMYPPGATPVRRGPYRIMNHPEYASRALELFGFSLLTGGYTSFAMYIGAIMILLPRIVVIEKRQIGVSSAAS